MRVCFREIVAQYLLSNKIRNDNYVENFKTDNNRFDVCSYVDV